MGGPLSGGYSRGARKSIDFSDHYYKTSAVIVAYKSMDIDGSPESLAVKIIGVQASTIHLAYANDHFGDAAKIRVYQTQDQANQDMFAGRIAAIQADSFAMVDFVGTDAGACCEVKGTVAKDEAILGRGVSAGVRKGDDVLREKLNMGIAAILSDGTHAAITARYFPTSIYSE